MSGTTSGLSKKYNIDKLLKDIPYAIRKNIQADEQALYSLTSYKLSTKITNIIASLEDINSNSIVIDATASVGGNIFTLSNYFSKVLAIELNEARFKMLLHNVQLLKLNNVRCLNKSCLEFFQMMNYIDVLFMDPEWGGVDYKKNKRIVLHIDNIPVTAICKRLKNKCKYIVLKVPNNINKDHYNDFNLTIINLYSFLLFIIKN